VLKAYAVGLLGGLVLALVVAGIYVATEPEPERGLRWGDTVYTSRAEFDAYLRSRGLSYKVWLTRNPGVAPWEPAVEGSEAAPGTSARVAAPGPVTDEDGRRLPVAFAGLMLAIGCGLLLLVHGLRTVVARAQAPPAPAPPRRARAGLGAKLATLAPLRRIGVLAASAVQGFDGGAARVSGRRPPNVPLPGFLRQRHFRASDVVFALLAAIAAGMFVVFVTLLLTA
jgi:hypothetical protein